LDVGSRDTAQPTVAKLRLDVQAPKFVVGNERPLGGPADLDRAAAPAPVEVVERLPGLRRIEPITTTRRALDCVLPVERVRDGSEPLGVPLVVGTPIAKLPGTVPPADPRVMLPSGRHP